MKAKPIPMWRSSRQMFTQRPSQRRSPLPLALIVIGSATIMYLSLMHVTLLKPPASTLTNDLPVMLYRQADSVPPIPFMERRQSKQQQYQHHQYLDTTHSRVHYFDSPSEEHKPELDAAVVWQESKSSEAITEDKSLIRREQTGTVTEATNLGKTPSPSQQSPQERNSDTSFVFAWQNQDLAEEYLQVHGKQSLQLPLTAYLEAPMNDTVPNTGSRGDMRNNSDKGVPPDLYTPLSLRIQSPDSLQKVVYSQVQSCKDIPSHWPVDPGLVSDPKTGKTVYWNVGDGPLASDFVQQELPHCPVEADPFLPWIHDVFPSANGEQIHFVAQNKRRCRTGSKFDEVVNRLLPQAALFQPVSVKRITEDEAVSLAPALWLKNDTLHVSPPPRYQLVPADETSPDGQYTRFICRFSAFQFAADQSYSQAVIVGETLSVYPFHYEYAAIRTGPSTIYTPKGKDSARFISATLLFSCPVPPLLHSVVANGQSILSDGTPTLCLDLVPIRTPARYPHVHMTSDLLGPLNQWSYPQLNAQQVWGSHHVIPHVEASGRWSNIPICHPPPPPPHPPSPTTGDDVTLHDTSSSQSTVSLSAETTAVLTGTKQATAEETPKFNHSKPHYLSACLWASALFKERGLYYLPALSDTLDRLLEWIEFHLIVGFDHIYVYDNSRAHTNRTNLQAVTNRFPPHQVTWIDWPAVPCNNNQVIDDSVGEHSSQFAAAASCRMRFGPYTEWIAEIGKWGTICNRNCFRCFNTLFGPFYRYG
jgi:hypothetical protein